MAKQSSSKAAIDPFRIFVQAEGFEVASLLLAKQFSNGDKMLRVPYVVNSSFATELFLKCLLHLEGKAQLAEGHELRKLYDKLDSAHRKEIESHYEQEKTTNPVLLEIFQQEKEARLPKLPWAITDVLDRANKAFPSWRYSFELVRNDMVYAGVQPIRDGVKKVVYHVMPSWVNS